MKILLYCLALLLPLSALAVPQKWKDELIYRTTLGSAKDVALLVDKVGSPNLTDSMNYPLLYIAASRTDKAAFDVVKKLVELGADVNYDGGMGNYPLMAAVQSDNVDIARFLLEKGANYRAQDGFGVSLVDYSRQSGNPEMRQLIEDAVQRDIRKMVSGRTQSALDRLTHDLAYHACALQYLTYYYESGQDDIPEAEQQAALEKHKAIVGESMGQLRATFRLSNNEVLQIFNDAKQAIFTEMENLISNRWRRKKGVGQPGDMEKRCEPIAAPYEKGHFDKSTLDQRVKY